MPHRADLGGFLKSCRARLGPVEVGLPPGSGQRRVVGLRREELALLAGISVDYYVRLEQGRCGSVSESVLDAIAAALRLTEDERDHLYRLARPGQLRPRPPVPQQVRPGLRQLVTAVGAATPAFVLGRRMDILAWNELASALITDFAALAPSERNLARLVLLDDKVSRLYPDRELVVRNSVGFLRLDLGRHPDDPRLAALVDDLCQHSPEFREQWQLHTVSRKRYGVKRFDHPVVGQFELDYESLYHPDDQDQLVIVYSAPPGSAAEAKLRELARRH
ncbi:helix-turn-helix transcriptional regulator [Plantactinospora sp. KLBMP9567]|uniref:helix-turn-helix transcriptional regulator n=1 Tax=Plantactinospora sp. KLBMP9567 TaxID=3085900 RepID=UPI002980C8DD|nr:helix-turn-helix transcriptional regulator [Plantactinospora sp. KLBMP9567]MDW5329507.1 helix-turn-helix transcriptional regulator [Plantactinospora sp. KLBMP9567]